MGKVPLGFISGQKCLLVSMLICPAYSLPCKFKMVTKFTSWQKCHFCVLVCNLIMATCAPRVTHSPIPFYWFLTSVTRGHGGLINLAWFQQVARPVWLTRLRAFVMGFGSMGYVYFSREHSVSFYWLYLSCSLKQWPQKWAQIATGDILYALKMLLKSYIEWLWLLQLNEWIINWLFALWGQSILLWELRIKICYFEAGWPVPHYCNIT